jgi:hypothetical protein
MFRDLIFGAAVGVVIGVVVGCALFIWANETNTGLILRSLDCYPSSSLGADGYVCYRTRT